VFFPPPPPPLTADEKYDETLSKAFICDQCFAGGALRGKTCAEKELLLRGGCSRDSESESSGYNCQREITEECALIHEEIKRRGIDYFKRKPSTRGVGSGLSARWLVLSLVL
jgi:hypothetical protein